MYCVLAVGGFQKKNNHKIAKFLRGPVGEQALFYFQVASIL